MKQLSNLWARDAALQCCFNQEAIDFLIFVYTGSLDADAIFEPKLLSGVAGQVKYKNAADPNAQAAIKAFGITRGDGEPLPSLMELGNESSSRQSQSKIKVETWEASPNDNFYKLQETWYDTVEKLDFKGVSLKRS